MARMKRRARLTQKLGVSQDRFGRKVAKIQREERAKPKGQRRSQAAIRGKAAGMLAGEQGKELKGGTVRKKRRRKKRR